MQKIVLLLALFGTLNSFAQKENNILIGTVDSLYSSVLKEKRKVWIYTPGINEEKKSDERYPVVYLLDGDGHFQSVAGMIQQLSEVNNILPKMIVVAILNTDRTRDLTPTHIDSDPPMMDQDGSRNTGGGENFTTFLEKELIPHIDSAFPTQPFRMLIGHSFGGLTVMNILTNHTKLFNAYIAIDPSMWYDKEKFLKTTQDKLSSQKFEGRTLYIGIANTLNEGMTIEKLKNDKTPDTRHIRSIFALDKFIKEHPQNGLRYASKYYGDDDHGSVPVATEYDGLRFIFNWYRFKLGYSDFVKRDTAVVQRLRKHYANASKELGYSLLPPKAQVNELARAARGFGHDTKVEALYRLNMENYPDDGTTFGSYGDMMLLKRDTASAIIYYKKAYTLTKDEDLQSKIKLLEGKPSFTLTPKDMEKYLGVFQFETVPIVATIRLQGNILRVSAPGQGDFELIPLSLHTFAVSGQQGDKIRFDLEGDKVIGLTFIQPNNMLKAKVKK